MPNLTHGSLFSGIGGFDLGFERAGIKTLWQVENDPYAVKVLERHWPNVKRYGDIKAIKWEAVEVPDIISGGFPCQPVSVAGKRRGQDDERWLWPEFARCLRILRPRYVVVENVPGLLALGFGDVLGDLAALGYDAEWDSIPAAAFGAPHLRYRVWIVAYAASMFGDGGNDNARVGLGREQISEPRNDCRAAAIPNPRSGGRGAGERDVLPGEPDAVRGGTLADASERCGRDVRTEGRERQGIFRKGRRKPEASMADAEGEPREVRAAETERPGGFAGGGTLADPFSIISGRYGVRWPSGVGWWEREPAEIIQDAREGRGQENGLPELKSILGRVAYGIPARVDRLKCLGNSIVPQIAEWLGRRIVDLAR